MLVEPWGSRLGGAEAILWLFLRHVDRERIDPTVVFLDDGPWLEEVRSLNIETLLVDAGRLRQPLRYLRAVSAIERAIADTASELVVSWAAKAHLYAGVAARRAGVRAAWWQQGIPADRHWIDRLAAVVPTELIACYCGDAEASQQAIHPRRPTRVIHPGIELSEPVVPILRTHLGIPPERFVVGIVGRLQPWKGQHLVIEAVAQLNQRGIDAHGLVVGGDAYGLSPQYAASLPALARRLGIDDRVTFTGHVPDALPYYGATDVAVNASRAEPFGMVVLEAMAQGVAIVAADAAGPREIIEPGVSGLLFADGGLVEKLVDLARNPDRRAALARGGRERVKLFAAPAMARTIERAFFDARGCPGDSASRSA